MSITNLNAFLAASVVSPIFVPTLVLFNKPESLILAIFKSLPVGRVPSSDAVIIGFPVIKKSHWNMEQRLQFRKRLLLSLAH